MEVDNLKMDMSGMELSVANAHLQIQRVEDEVIKDMKDQLEEEGRKDYVWRGGVADTGGKDWCPGPGHYKSIVRKWTKCPPHSQQAHTNYI
jgi:hypothetical protein